MIPAPPQERFTDVANCSTLYAGLAPAEAAQAAAADGYRFVEFWWPFPTPEPADAALRRFADGLDATGVRLVALNFYGGDMAAGERGILHRTGLSTAHIDAMGRLHELTGVTMGNLLPGAGGPIASAEQVRRLSTVADALAGAITPLLEPMSGNPDLPVRDPWTASELATDTGCGVLVDFYHLAEHGIDVDLYLTFVEDGRLAPPTHVQVADSPGRGAPGTGTAPLRAWVGRLRGAGYDGHVAAEWMA